MAGRRTELHQRESMDLEQRQRDRQLELLEMAMMDEGGRAWMASPEWRSFMDDDDLPPRWEEPVPGSQPEPEPEPEPETEPETETETEPEPETETEPQRELQEGVPLAAMGSFVEAVAGEAGEEQA